MTVPFRLGVGDHGPTQQSQVSCGAACLTVARMRVDPAFSRWILDGIGPQAGDARAATTDKRFALSERTVMGRTNSLFGPGRRLQLPWPRALGTPPWGALAELEHGAALPGTRYELRAVRAVGPVALGAVFDTIARRVRDGRPVLLYVGNAVLPRHVTMALVAEGDTLGVYDPSSGRVERVTRAQFTKCQVDLGGWRRPWFVIQPQDQVAVRDAAPGWGTVRASAVG